MVAIIREAVFGSFNSISLMAKIIIPLMIVLQLARDYKILDKIKNSFNFITKFLGMSSDSIFPLLVGGIFGISYGAGVIIETAKEGQLSKKDLILVVSFLVACHGIIEDTLIFAVIGANALVLILLRLISAIVLTYFLSKALNNDGSFKYKKNKTLNK